MSAWRTDATRVDLDTIEQEVTAAEQPIIAKEAKVHRAYHEWFEKRMRDPNLIVSTEPPSEVNERLHQLATQRAAARLAVFERHQPDLLRELEADVQAVAERLEAAVTAVERLASTEAKFNKLAQRCGVVTLADSLAYDIVSRIGVRAWRERADRVLHPPAVRIPQPVASPPLVLE